jgi:hydroxylamine reductase (hybrid-cluster protein)
MIWADGIVTDNEYSTLQKYVSMFGFVEENVKDIADYFIEAVKQQKVSRIF